MNKKILIASASFFVSVAVLAGVVFVLQKTNKQEQQNFQVAQYPNQEEDSNEQNEQIEKAHVPEIEEIKPIDLQTVQHQSQEKDQNMQTDGLQEGNASNWLTYANENENFTIKYPSDLFLREPVQEGNSPVLGKNVALVISDKEDAELQAIDPNEAVHIVISKSKKKEGQTLQELVYAMAVEEENSVAEVFVNGNKGYRFFSEDITVPLLYFFEKDDWIYSLTGVNYLEGDARSESYKRMDEICSTFDFL